MAIALFGGFVNASEARDLASPPSDSPARVRESIRARLAGTGAKVAIRALSATTGGFGSSLVADFPSDGTRRSGGSLETVVVALPLPLAVDNFGLSAALALADLMAKEKPSIPVRIAFLADERSALPRDLRGKTHLGLRDLADSLGDGERTAIVYLNLSEAPSRPVLEHGSAGSIAPRFLVEALRKAFSDGGDSTKSTGPAALPEALPAALPLAIPYNELYRLKLIQGPEELGILSEREIPAVLLRDSKPFAVRGAPAAGLSAEQTAHALSRAIARLAAAPSEQDRRYSFISFAQISLLLSEGAAVAAFIGLAALFLLAFLVYSLTHRHLLVARWIVFLRRSWVIFAFLGLLFACVMASGFALDFALAAAKASAATEPYGAATLKILLSLALFFLVSPLLNFRFVPRRAHFFGSAAVFCLAFGALLAAALDFTFVPTVMWAFAFAFLSSSVNSPSLALLPALLAPLQIIGAVATAAGSTDAGTANAVLRGGPLIDLYLAFIALPFVFLYRRLVILRHARTVKRVGAPIRGHRRFTRPILVIGLLCAVAVFARNSAETERGKAPAVRAEASDRERFSAESTRTVFLDRSTERLSLRSSLPPARVDLRLNADEHITIYEAPVPFTLTNDGKTAFFSLGELPPETLELDVTLPAGLKGAFEARAIFYDPKTDAALTLHDRAEIGTAPLK